MKLNPTTSPIRLLPIAVMTLVAAGTFAEDGVEIRYRLEDARRVSLAVYDADGRMVRTLRSGESQTGGKQVVAWDGLDLDGRPAAAGDYEWRLLSSQGMKAEYLLSLGTSVGIEHWVGQHGGPNTVALDGDSFFVGGHPEGSPLMVKAGLDGAAKFPIAEPWGEPASGTSKIAVDGGTLFVLMGSSRLWTFDAKDGNKTRTGTPVLLPVRMLDAIAPTSGAVNVEIAVPRDGRYSLRMKVGQDARENAAVSLKMKDRDWNFSAQAAGKFNENFVPRLYDNVSPVKSDDGKLSLTLKGDGDKSWAAPVIELLTPAEFIDARFGEVVASFPASPCVAWLDPATGKILETVRVPDELTANDSEPVGGSVALIAPGEALLICGHSVLQLSRKGGVTRRVAGLSAPVALAFDPPSGGYWVADGAGSEQIKLFDAAHKLVKTFGRKGGRLEGSYDPKNFLGVTDLASDGRGGFVVVEPLSAPRRTAHFDASGKLLREWYGGQQFYTFAAPDPENPAQVWMDSQWGWMMQCEVDWMARTWRVLACYRWGGDAHEGLFNRYKMAQPHHVRRFDFDKDGKTETYLVSNSGLQLVDEKAGRLRVVSTLGLASHNHGWEWSKLPIAKQPKPWVDAIEKLGTNELRSLSKYRAFAWADAKGDYEFQPEEFVLAPDAQAEGRGGFLITRTLDVIKQATWGGTGGDGKANWQVFPLQGFTPSHAPMWDWRKFAPGAVSSPRGVTELIEGDAGAMYQISQNGGDGYTALDTYAMGHGFGWPANMNDASAVMKWDAQGRMIWRAGNHATTQNSAPGRLHHPVHFAGLVNGTIGICDKVAQPVSFWTEDGLYAGSLLDRRADDGLPSRVYSWWKGATDDFHPEHGRALFQYDMILGGSLIPQPNGEAIYIGAGWNNCPAFRVSGWNDFKRMKGKLRLANAVTAAARNGTGLRAELSGGAACDGQVVWAEPKRAAQKKKSEFNWPVPEGTSGDFSLRYSGFIEAPFSEPFTFAIYKGSAGSARLFIGGRLVLDAATKEKKFYASPLPLIAGQKYPIEVEWTGPADGELHLCWESESQPIEHVPLTSLYPPDGKSVPVVTVTPPPDRLARPAYRERKSSVLAWTLARTCGTEAALEVPIMWGGNAVPGRDVKALPAVARFAAGESAVTVEVALLPVSRAIATTIQISLIPSVSAAYRLDGFGDAPETLAHDPRAQRLAVSQIIIRHDVAETSGGPKPQLNAAQLTNLVNRSGLDEAARLHGTDIRDAWTCAFTKADQLELIFDLATNCIVTELRVWNLNTTSAHGKSWGQGEAVHYAADQLRVSFARQADGPWTDAGTFALETPTGKGANSGEYFLIHGPARYVRLTFPPGHKGSFGLAEIEFWGIEQP